MYAAKKLKNQKKIQKATGILSTSTEVRAFRVSLEQETQKAYDDFAQSKQKVRELAHMKYLD